MMIDKNKIESLVGKLIGVIKESDTCIHEDFIAIKIITQLLERKVAAKTMEALFEAMTEQKKEGSKVDDDIIEMLKFIVPGKGE